MNQQLPQFIHRIIERLQSIQGIAAIALGGSRARGNHTQKSDVDLGIYYLPENPLDVAALNHLASEVDDDRRPNRITPIGEWGKWINGGGWLRIEGVPVDFLYRDVARVNRIIDDCHAGEITIDYQPGHPHGFVSSIYMGEVAHCLPLYDPDGVLAALKAKTTPYPIQLQQATVNTFAWEISFSLSVAQKAVARGDVAYAAGCCFRSVACMNLEIGVAATKTFIAQLMAFYALALDLAYLRQAISPTELQAIIDGLRQVPGEIEANLEKQEHYIGQLAHNFAETKDFIFLGRGINYPIALEGALKLKEISYIHAEGYPAGEMKHGPIALLDAKVPVVAIAMPGSVYEKVISNSQEAKARDSRLIGVTPVNDGEAGEIFNDILPVSHVNELLSPILTVIPLQLLAYHIAALRGLDVDQPRNLAKSVTVE
ncbi:hypothetical protein NUACC21_34130 [Scytonema sp. NUACC21]